jgi:Ion transport protein
VEYDYDIALIISIIFTSLFTIEAMMKIIAFGFVLDSHSYLTESWSQLDFFIVIVSWIDVSVTTVNLRFVRILRLLRTLRPLRFISHNIQMKLVVTALLESVSGIMNVVLVIILVWMMFAILAIELMQYKMNFCSLPSQSPYTIYQVN